MKDSTLSTILIIILLINPWLLPKILTNYLILVAFIILAGLLHMLLVKFIQYLRYDCDDGELSKSTAFHIIAKLLFAAFCLMCPIAFVLRLVDKKEFEYLSYYAMFLLMASLVFFHANRQSLGNITQKIYSFKTLVSQKGIIFQWIYLSALTLLVLVTVITFLV